MIVTYIKSFFAPRPIEDDLGRATPEFILKPFWIPAIEKLPDIKRGFIVRTSKEYIVIAKGFRNEYFIERWFKSGDKKLAWVYFEDNCFTK